MKRCLHGALLLIIGLIIAGCTTTATRVPSTPDVYVTSSAATISASADSPLSSPTAKPASTTAPTVVPTPTFVSTPPPTVAPTAEPTSPPTAVPSPILSAPPVRLIIDSIDLDRVIIPVGLDANRVPVVLDHDVGWYKLGAMPGQGENIVLWGHVLRFRKAPHIPAPFARLKELRPGASVILIDERGNEYRYIVSRQVWAKPDEVHYMLPQGREMVTMISCIGDKVIAKGSIEMTHRLITIAEPADEER